MYVHCIPVCACVHTCACIYVFVCAHVYGVKCRKISCKSDTEEVRAKSPGRLSGKQDAEQGRKSGRGSTEVWGAQQWKGAQQASLG